MSSLAYPGQAGSRRPRRSATALVSAWGSDVLLAIAMAVLSVALLTQLDSAFGVDSWLALVAGRQIWSSGIPHHETLTLMSRGRTWVDQQWLSQLASYALYRLGGLSLLGLVNVALIVGPVTAAVVMARRLQAPFRSVLLAVPFCLALVIPAREIRTQEFGIPLFVATVALLAADSRSPSRRVFWCLPILALWANLHGSVTLGAGLVALRGLTVAWERRRALGSSARAWRRPLALVVLPAAAVLLTPYGLAIVGYYHSTMADGTLRQFVTEWQPVTAVPIDAADLLALAAVTIWTFGRHPDKTTLWEKLAFLVLVAGTVSVVRNELFCGLFSLIVVPVSWAYGPASAAPTLDRRRGLVNGALALTAAGVLVAATVAVASRSSAAIDYSTYSPRLAATVADATRADPSLTVLADPHFSDWLLWNDPGLSGRIASDVRYELLTDGQLTALQNLLDIRGSEYKQAARGYRLLVLTGASDASVGALIHEPGARVLYRDGPQVVILRSAREAASA